MNTKEKLLLLFEENKGICFSGEELAEKLNVSRTAVWKAINSLRSDGYKFTAVSGKGYSLSVDTDILSEQGIRKYLKPVCRGIKPEVLHEVESTNTLLRKKAEAGAPEGYAIIANSQTNGRGRMGRSFYSPSDTGIYLSLLLRPVDMPFNRAVRITTMAAVAACEAIEEVAAKPASIKWVNDIFMNGRKVSGILTEAALGMENGSLDYVVLGIGINAYPPENGFPEDIENIAGAVFEKRHNDGKNHLAAEFLNRFMGFYTSGDYSQYAQKYRDRSMVLGKEINVLTSKGPQKAVALDVDEECCLIVQYEDGRTDRLSSGEISIRMAEQEEGR